MDAVYISEVPNSEASTIDPVKKSMHSKVRRKQQMSQFMLSSEATNLTLMRIRMLDEITASTDPVCIKTADARQCRHPSMLGYV